MNNLIKNISASFLLTASTLGVMASGQILSDSEGSQSSSGTSNISHKRSSGDERSEVDNNQGISSKKIKVEPGLFAEVDSSEANPLSLKKIKAAVRRKAFNLEGGEENCLECSLNFVSYILSGGTECRSAVASLATEPNFQTFNDTRGEVLGRWACENFGEPAVLLHQDGPAVNDLTDYRFAGFSSVGLDLLHDMLSAKSKEIDSDSVGILYLEYKDALVKGPINAHFMNYLILGGQLMYVDAQAGSMKEELNTNSYKTAYYRSFPLKKVQSIVEVKVKAEPVSRCYNQEIADDSIVPSPFDVSAPNRDKLGSVRILKNEAPAKNRLAAAKKILMNSTLTQHHAAAAAVAVSLLSNKHLTATEKLFGANVILMNSTLTQHHATAAETVMCWLSTAYASATERLVGAKEILMKPTLIQYHATAAETAVSLLSDTSIHAHNRLVGANVILINSTSIRHHAAAAETVMSLLSDTSIHAHDRLVGANVILINSTSIRHHAAAAETVMSLLSNTFVSATERLVGAKEILKKPTLTHHHAAAARVALSLLSNESLHRQLKEDVKLLLKNYIDSL